VIQGRAAHYPSTEGKFDKGTSMACPSRNRMGTSASSVITGETIRHSRSSRNEGCLRIAAKSQQVGFHLGKRLLVERGPLRGFAGFCRLPGGQLSHCIDHPANQHPLPGWFIDALAHHEALLLSAIENILRRKTETDPFARRAVPAPLTEQIALGAERRTEQADDRW
jgi:hypothetical protein